MDSKKCSKCNIIKPLEEFSKQAKVKCGRRSQCKICIKNKELNRSEEELARIRKVRNNHYVKNVDKKKAYQKAYRVENLEKVSATEKSYKIKNKDKVAQYKKEYRVKNLDKINEQYKEYYEKNKDRLIEYQKEYFQNNKEYVTLRSKKYYENNKDAILATTRIYCRKRRATDSQYRVRMNMSCAIWHGLKRKKFGKGWQTLVPYTIQELMSHLESKFTEGMTWKNYGKNGWEIDHIIPQAYFKYDSYDHPAFKVCWALENLQPLWAKDNASKRDRIKITPKIKKFLKSVNGE